MPGVILPLCWSKGIPDWISANPSRQASALPWIQPVFWLRIYLGGKKCGSWLLKRGFLLQWARFWTHVRCPRFCPTEPRRERVMQIPNFPLGPGAANKPPALEQTPAAPSEGAPVINRGGKTSPGAAIPIPGYHLWALQPRHNPMGTTSLEELNCPAGPAAERPMPALPSEESHKKIGLIQSLQRSAHGYKRI